MTRQPTTDHGRFVAAWRHLRSAGYVIRHAYDFDGRVTNATYSVQWKGARLLVEELNTAHLRDSTVLNKDFPSITRAVSMLAELELLPDELHRLHCTLPYVTASGECIPHSRVAELAGAGVAA